MMVSILPLFTPGGTLVQPSWKSEQRFLKAPHDPDMITCPSTLGQHTTQTLVHLHLFLHYSKKWSQLTYISTDEKLRKMWIIYTVEFYSAIKKNKLKS